MRSEWRQIVKPWSPDSIRKMKLEGCGQINCRSRLGDNDTVGEEIRRILSDKFRGMKKADS